MEISPEEMFKRLSQQDHIRKLINETGNDGSTQYINVTRQDLIRTALIGVETCINLLVLKGIVSIREVAHMTDIMAEAYNELFEEVDGNEEDGE